MQTINIGDTLTCTETGKQFTAQRDGCSYNYALDREGRIYSDEGVDIRERRDMLDRSKPFYCYVSCDGGRVTGWKGNKLGDIVGGLTVPPRGSLQPHRFRVCDVHGNWWTGRGAGTGMCCTLRAMKPPR